jgi:hypothetical protein
MRWPVGLFLWGLLLSATGCRNNDLVEAELRTRDNDLRELRADLDQAQLQNQALMRELSAIRQGTAPALTPELASQTYTLKQITLGRGTGGYDDDNCPGDEAVQVVIEPKDCDDHTIKAPGTLHVEALEISREGIKTPLCSWDVAPPQLRRLWRSGLLSTGYFVVLQWKNWPSSEKVRIIAHFTLADGRGFEAEKDVTIRLTPAAFRKTPPPFPLEAPSEPALPEPEGIPLPFPRKVDSRSGSSTSRAWWVGPDSMRGATAASLRGESTQPTPAWRPKAEPSVADAVELLRPAPLRSPPGQSP